MRLLDSIVSRLENSVCIVTFVVMLLLSFANVVSRFVLHMSMSFTEEIVTGLFVLASLTGASIAVRKRAHLGLDFVIGFMPEKVRLILSFVATILALGLCGIMFVYGIFMVKQEMFLKQLTATTQWPEWIYGMTVPIGAGILVLRYLIVLYEQAVGKEESADA